MWLDPGDAVPDEGGILSKDEARLLYNVFIVMGGKVRGHDWCRNVIWSDREARKIDQLVEKGMINSRRCHYDTRAVVMMLTVKGAITARLLGFGADL